MASTRCVLLQPSVDRSPAGYAIYLREGPGVSELSYTFILSVILSVPGAVFLAVRRRRDDPGSAATLVFVAMTVTYVLATSSLIEFAENERYSMDLGSLTFVASAVVLSALARVGRTTASQRRGKCASRGVKASTGSSIRPARSGEPRPTGNESRTCLVERYRGKLQRSADCNRCIACGAGQLSTTARMSAFNHGQSSKAWVPPPTRSNVPDTRLAIASPWARGTSWSPTLWPMTQCSPGSPGWSAGDQLISWV